MTGIIQELPEESFSQSAHQSLKKQSGVTFTNQDDQLSQLNQSQAAVTIYKRVDQEELERLELDHKSEFSFDDGSLQAVFRYTQLQRFRKGKNLKAVDKYKPELDEQKRKEVRDRENQWYRENVITEE